MKANRFSKNSFDKIKNLDELAKLVQRFKAEGKTVVHCHGVFDLLHPGHIRHFQAAKRLGDVLIVTLTRDKFVDKGPGHPAFNESLRAESLAALEYVDFVAINRWPTAVETIRKIKPNIYVKGKDYSSPADDVTGKILEEEEAIQAVGGKLHITDEITFSSTQLINAYFPVYPEEAEGFLKDFRSRYEEHGVRERINSLRRLKVLLIGDTIVDEYYYVKPLGKTPKETLISTLYQDREAYAGGVLAIANHMAGFCGQVHLATCLGSQQSSERFIRSHLKPNVEPHFFHRDDAATIIKRRFVDRQFMTKLFEIHYMNDSPLPQDVTRAVVEHLASYMRSYDLVVVADYGHGLIGPEIVEQLCRGDTFLAVNCQTNSSNTGFNLITKYPRADFFCLDEIELRLASHDEAGCLEDILRAMAQRMGCGRAVATLGHRGSMTFGREEGICNVPVFSREVVDRMGAGDAYFAITALCAASGFPMELTGVIGNAVGALKVRIVGNKAPVESAPLLKFLTALLK